MSTRPNCERNKSNSKMKLAMVMVSDEKLKVGGRQVIFEKFGKTHRFVHTGLN